MMSWPHFFQADSKLLDAVEGLKPDPEKHQFYIDVQPVGDNWAEILSEIIFNLTIFFRKWATA